MSSLAEEYPKEQERLRAMLPLYREIGPPGAFALAMIEDCLKRADKAAAEQDLAKIVRVFAEMKEFKL